jgi:hypothetical protein
LSRADIRYVYTVDGADYEGNCVYFGSDQWLAARERVTEMTDLYPSGRVLKVFCDPKSPQKAVLERGQQKGAQQHLVTALKLGAAAAACALLSTWVN